MPAWFQPPEAWWSGTPSSPAHTDPRRISLSNSGPRPRAARSGRPQAGAPRLDACLHATDAGDADQARVLGRGLGVRTEAGRPTIAAVAARRNGSPADTQREGPHVALSSPFGRDRARRSPAADRRR